MLTPRHHQGLTPELCAGPRGWSVQASVWGRRLRRDEQGARRAGHVGTELRVPNYARQGWHVTGGRPPMTFPCQEGLHSHQEPFWLSASPNFPVIEAQPPKLPDPRWGPWTRLWRGALPLPEPGLTAAPKQASASPQTYQQSPSQPSWRLLVTRAWTPLTPASISPPHAPQKPSGWEIRSTEPRQVFW